MSKPYINKMAEKTGMDTKKLESYWQEAENIALKDRSKKDDNFYAYVMGIFKNMIGEGDRVAKEDIEDIANEYYEYISEEGEVAGTVSGDIAQPDRHLLGKPLFRVSHKDFFKIGFNKREKGWWKKFYGSRVGDWCKNNKGKDFSIEHEDKNWLMDLKAV